MGMFLVMNGKRDGRRKKQRDHEDKAGIYYPLFSFIFLQYLLLNSMCICKYLLFFIEKFCPHKEELSAAL